MWVPLWGAGTAAPSNPGTHPEEGHPRLPLSAFQRSKPLFLSFFFLSRITARAMLQGRVLTGMVAPGKYSPARLRRAERVNCSLGKTDPVPAGWEVSNSFLEATATPLGSFPTAPSLTTQGLPQHGMVRHSMAWRDRGT